MSYLPISVYIASSLVLAEMFSYLDTEKEDYYHPFLLAIKLNPYLYELPKPKLSSIQNLLRDGLPKIKQSNIYEKNQEEWKIRFSFIRGHNLQHREEIIHKLKHIQSFHRLEASYMLLSGYTIRENCVITPSGKTRTPLACDCREFTNGLGCRHLRLIQTVREYIAA